MPNTASAAFVPAALDKPYIAQRGFTLRVVPRDSGLSAQFEVLVGDLAAALGVAFAGREASIVPDAQGQRVELRIDVAQEAGAVRLYRFDCLLLARPLTESPGAATPRVSVVPRLFGEVTGLEADGVVRALQSDAEFAGVYGGVLKVLANLARVDGPLDVRRDDSAGILGAPTCYASRLYNVDGFGDDVSLPHRLGQLTFEMNRRLREAFKSRGALVLPHPQSFGAQLTYRMPHTDGGDRVFQFQIQLQAVGPSTSIVAADGAVATNAAVGAVGDHPRATVFPRLFGEVIRRSPDNVLFAEGTDEAFTKLVVEIEALLQQL